MNLAATVGWRIPHEAPAPPPAPPTGVFSTAGGNGLVGIGGTAELPPTPEVLPGDALVLFVMHQLNATFGAPPGWTTIGGGTADSSAVFLRMRAFGRIADGTADDAAPYTVDLGGSSWALAVFRALDDVQFPGAFTGSGSSYQYGLEGSGIHPKDVTKSVFTNQAAFAIGFAAATSLTIDAPPTDYITIVNQQFALVGGAPYDGVIGKICTSYNSSLVTDTINPDAFTLSNPSGTFGEGALTLVVSWAP